MLMTKQGYFNTLMYVAIISNHCKNVNDQTRVFQYIVWSNKPHRSTCQLHELPRSTHRSRQTDSDGYIHMQFICSTIISRIHTIASSRIFLNTDTTHNLWYNVGICGIRTLHLGIAFSSLRTCIQVVHALAQCFTTYCFH